jgi:small subunit ribosomal protein S2
MKELEEIDFDDTTKGFTKKELLIKKRELDKLHKSLGGIRNLTKTPSALWVVDTKKEHLAIDEARKLGIPVIGILDTNCDPDEVQYPIPGNDDAIRSVALLTRIVADAAAEGLIQRHQKSEGDGEAAEPMAEWEAELLQSGTPSPEEVVVVEEIVAEEIVADEAAVETPVAVEPVEAPAESAEPASSPVEPAETPVAAEAEAPAEKKPAARKAPAKPAAEKSEEKAEKSAKPAAEKKPAAKAAKPAAESVAKAETADESK